MATRNNLKQEVRRAREWYRGQASDADIARHVGITVEELQELENPAPQKPPKAPRKAMVRPKASKPQDDTKAPIMTRSVLSMAHYGGTIVLGGYEILFFLSLAPNYWWLQGLAILSAIVFTFGEVGLWERGVWYNQRKPKILAACMALFSFLGGAAMSLGDVALYERASSVVDISALKSEYLEYGGQISALEEKLAALDPTWVTNSLKLNSEIKALKADRDKVSAKIAEAGNIEADAGINVQVFLQISKAFGNRWGVGTVALWFLLFRTFMLIVVTLSTSKTREVCIEGNTAPKLPKPQGDKVTTPPRR